MKLSIFGDLSPTQSNMQLFRDGRINEIFGDTLELIEEGDFTALNLECAVGDEVQPGIKKNGPRLVVPSFCLKQIADAGFDIVCVANNHAMDNGVDSLDLEFSQISSLGMSGVGIDTESNHSPHCTVEKDGVTCSVLAVSDREFNHSDELGGVSIFDPLTVLPAVSKLSGENDAVVVLYHTGLENYRYATPDLKKRCRAMIDAGAKAVICQHSHCIGAAEEYKGGFVLYGQGNFLFDQTDRISWHESLIVQLDIEKEAFSYRLVPSYCQEGRAGLMEDAKASEVIADLNARSEIICSDNQLKQKLSDFLLQEKWKYNAMLSGGGKFRYIFFRIFDRFFKKMYVSERKRLILCSLLMSDTQREAITELLDK